jgi:hypothetical protein
MDKNFFTFKWFDDLKVGDTFKFCPTIDSDIPSKFFTVYYKDEFITKFNSTYGKELNKMEFLNDTHKEIMLFPNRKKIIHKL